MHELKNGELFNCSKVGKFKPDCSRFIFEHFEEAEIRESRLGINGFFDRNSDLKSGYFR